MGMVVVMVRAARVGMAVVVVRAVRVGMAAVVVRWGQHQRADDAPGGCQKQRRKAQLLAFRCLSLASLGCSANHRSDLTDARPSSQGLCAFEGLEGSWRRLLGVSLPPIADS